jgi:hypothetical protein
MTDRITAYEFLESRYTAAAARLKALRQKGLLVEPTINRSVQIDA